MPLPPFMPVQYHVHRFAMSPEKLAQLPSDVRCALIILGHISNEVATLYRAVMFSRHPESNPALSSYQTMQFIVFSRLLIGKVAEGYQFGQSRIFKKPLGKTFIPQMKKKKRGEEIVNAVTKQIGGNGLLARIRNEHVFHHPTDAAIENAFKKTLQGGADWSFMMAEQVHTVCFPASSNVAVPAMLAVADADVMQANTKLSSETFQAAGTLLEFIELFYLTVCDAYSIVDKVEPTYDLTNSPQAQDVKVPPVCFST
jgi:hypothetical protein